MGGPSVASLKFAFWLVSVTFLLHCLLIPTAITDLRARSYKENRGVRRTGLMPREAYVPPSVKSKRFKRGLCGLECVGKQWCQSFNADLSTGKCELFDTESGGGLINDPDSSYYGKTLDLLCGEMAVENGQTVASGVKDGEAVNVVCNDGYEADPSQAICNNGRFNTVNCVRATTTTITTPTTTTTTPTTTTPDDNNCILLIGGGFVPAPAVVYYHPTAGVKCNADIIGSMSTERIHQATTDASGCYLPSTQQVVICETNAIGDKPPMVYGLTDGSAMELPLPYSTYTKGSTAAAVGPSKCLSCGGDAGGEIADCYQFDSAVDGSNWTSIAPMPYQSYFAASVSLTESDFYVMGGYALNPLGNLNQLYRYNVTNGTWHEETPMPTKRERHAAAPLSKTEFIVCGGGEGDTTTSCELYDTTQKKWRVTGSLSQARAGYAMISFGGYIYALGGFNGGNTVEKYDRATGEWQLAKAMTLPRYAFIAVVVEGFRAPHHFSLF